MGEHRDRLRAGQEYLPGADDLVADRAHARARLARFAATAPTDPAGGAEILRELLGSLGEDTEVLAPLHCDYGYGIEIGPRTFINVGAVLLDSAPVRIGADVQIGPYVQLLSPVHPLDARRRRAGWEQGRPVTVEDGVWLAAGVLVCPGVTVGRDTVVGAGSVVTRDMPAGHLCHGNPCRPVRRL